MAVDVVFAHGAGGAGVDAWPHQAAEAEASWRFLPRDGVADDAGRDARRVLDCLRPAGGGHVVADDPTVSAREFSRRFAAAMGTEPPDLPDEELEARVGRLRTLSPPWDTGFRSGQDIPARTLVITGGWSPLYEETAVALVASGAERLTLDGTGHRVQDHPQCTQALREHWTD